MYVCIPVLGSMSSRFSCFFQGSSRRTAWAPADLGPCTEASSELARPRCYYQIAVEAIGFNSLLLSLDFSEYTYYHFGFPYYGKDIVIVGMVLYEFQYLLNVSTETFRCSYLLGR